jgi:hypothetical protein
VTKDEHRLVIEMFKQQAIYYADLLVLLQSRGVIESGDMERFDEWISHTTREPLERNVVENYLESGRRLGVTGLPEAGDC